MEGIILVLLTGLIMIGYLTFIGITIYGICLCFSKKWYMGLLSLVVPLFGFCVGLGKICKKDLLA